MRRTAPLSLAAVVAAFALAAGACGEDLQRADAAFRNEIDTVSLYALSGTPVGSPSAYLLAPPDPRPVRSDQTAELDFAFDLAAAGAPQLIPTGPLGLGEGSGLQPGRFDEVTLAPTRGYVYDAPAAADSGVELLVQSRVDPVCGTSYYAKLRVLAVDTVERSIRFEILANANCGYRALEPGFPTR